MISAQAEHSPVGTSENNLLFNTWYGFSARLKDDYRIKSHT